MFVICSVISSSCSQIKKVYVKIKFFYFSKFYNFFVFFFMSDVTPRILRPSSTLSYVAKTQNKSPRLTPTPHSTANLHIRQIFPSPRDTSTLVDFKTSYQTLMNAVASFLSHNNTTIEFRLKFNSIIKELDENLNKFIVATPKHTPDLSDPKYSRQFLRRFLPFGHTFWDFSGYIKTIRQSGTNPIHEALDMHFQIITDTLDVVKNSSQTVTGMHDPIIRRSKALQSQLMNLKRIALDVIQNKKDSTKITTEIRSFSRLLNSAYTTDFNSSPLGQTQLEKLRSESYTSCCAIIHNIRESGLFQQHSSDMFAAFDHFKSSINHLLEKNGVEKKLSELCGEEEEEAELVIKFDKNLSLQELIEKGKEAFDDDKVLEYINLIEIAANDILSENETIKGKLENLKNIKKLQKQAEIERDAARKIQEDIQKENEELKMMMNENNEKMAEYDSNAGTDTQYKKTVLETIPRIASYLNEEVHNPASDQSTISYFLTLMNSVFSQKCQRCVSLLQREEEINEMLSNVIEVKNDVIENVQTMLDLYYENQKNLKSRTLEMNAANQQVGQMRESYFKILSLFDAPQNKTIDIGVFTYETVKDEVEKLRSKVSQQEQENIEKQNAEEELENRKKTAQQEYVANLIKRLQEILKTDELLSVEQYLFEIENKLGEYSRKESNNELFLSDLSNTLHSLLHKEKNNEEPVENGLLEITELLKIHINEIERKNDELQEDIKKIYDKSRDYSKIGRELNDLLEKKRDYKTEDEVLEQIDDVASILRSYKAQQINLKQDIVSFKLTLEDMIKMFNTYLDKKETQQNITDTHMLTNYALDLCKEVVSKKIDFSLEDITKLFDPIIDLIHVTNKTDPFTFIPEFVDEFHLLETSVTAMKPIAQILNNIYTHFDCQFANFNPSSQQYQYFKDQVLQMHNSLNQMSAAKTHNLIFLVLSRFVTLISSVMNAVTVAFSTTPKA